MSAWAAGRAPAAPLPAGTIVRAIPGTGEAIPAIGLGSWRAFDVAAGRDMIAGRAEILRRFFELGGRLIDSSPMYGRSEQVIGRCLEAVGPPADWFAATKVWIRGRDPGIQQMQESARLWGVARFDLMQVHNLLDCETHLATLAAWKAEGRVRYVGVTTSHGLRHTEMAALMRAQPLDFVQLTYNLVDRAAEQRLLPLARDRGIAVIVNRPFRGSELFERVRGKPVPAWAAAFDCDDWPGFFLKFILAHPAVTCAIPASSRLDHLAANMRALTGALPDRETCERMAAYYAGL